MTRDEPTGKFEYHGGACAHPACQLRTLQLDIARVKTRQRYERPKTKIEFSPFGVIKW